MALTPSEQIWADWIKKIIPRHYFAQTQVDELAAGFAKMFEECKVNADALFEKTFILTATGSAPDWLQMHASDRGTSRFDGESDTTLAARLRTVEGSVSPDFLLDAVNDVLEAAGFPRTAVLVELRLDKAYMLTNSEDTGTGGTFAVLSGSTATFVPTTPFEAPPAFSDDIVFTGATNAANNGTYSIISLLDHAAVYTNASLVAGADPSVTWRRKRKSLQGFNTDGFKDAYLSRGYRIGKNLENAIIIILPYPSTAAVQSTVTALVNQRKGAGVVSFIERRLVP